MSGPRVAPSSPAASAEAPSRPGAPSGLDADEASQPNAAISAPTASDRDLSHPFIPSERITSESAVEGSGDRPVGVRVRLLHFGEAGDAKRAIDRIPEKQTPAAQRSFFVG